MSYITRRKTFRTVEVRMTNEIKARLYWAKTLKTEEVILFTMYMRRRTSKVRILKVLPPDCDHRLEEVCTLPCYSHRKRKLARPGREYADTSRTKNRRDFCENSNRGGKVVFIKGCKPHCFNCAKQGHVRTECNLP